MKSFRILVTKTLICYQFYLRNTKQELIPSDSFSRRKQRKKNLGENGNNTQFWPVIKHSIL